MDVPKNLFLNVARDQDGRVWGVARLCLKDGSCLVIESRVYRENCQHAGGDEDDDEPAKNKALDEALDKLCRLTKNKVVMRAVPLPGRIALKAVCRARNLSKIKKAAQQDGDDETYDEAAGALKLMRTSKKPQVQRAHKALIIWQK